MEAALEQFYGSLQLVFFVIYLLYPIWLPLLLITVFWDVWIRFVRSKFIHNTKSTLLEIKIPREVKQSPAAMEIVVNALYQAGGESTWYDRYILGKVRSWFSLEIASLGGEIHFFIWTHEKWRNLIESQLYSQYPGIEIYEVPDYAHFVRYDGENMEYWGGEFVLSQDNYLPLKTYVDYKMDEQVGKKPDERIDPLTATIELFSSISQREQVWLQLVVRAHKGKRTGIWPFDKTTKWQDRGKKFIEDKSKKAPQQVEVGAEQSANTGFINKTEYAQVEAVARNIAKNGYDTGIRLLYMGDKDAFNGANIPGLIGAYRQFGSNTLNSLKPNHVTDYDFPWQKAMFKGKLGRMKKDMIDAYQRRQFFHSPYARKHSVINSEQLATLYHFPSGLVETPAFGRIQSRKAEPPTNLPT